MRPLLAWKIRTGGSGCAAAGFVSAVRIAPPRLFSRPQLSPFHHRKAGSVVRCVHTRLPPLFDDSAAQTLLCDGAYCADTRQHPPKPLSCWKDLESPSLFRHDCEDLCFARVIRLLLRPFLYLPARETLRVQAPLTLSADPATWYRSRHSLPLRGARQRTCAAASDSAYHPAKLRFLRDAPTEIRSRCRWRKARSVRPACGQCSRPLCCVPWSVLLASGARCGRE